MNAQQPHARSARRRKVKVRLRPTWAYSMRWNDLDGVTGESGHGLRAGLRTWWQVRRGTWEDDIWDDFEYEMEEAEQ